MRIDFPSLAQQLLGQAEALLCEWLPGGKRQGTEYACAGIEGGPGRSFSVNVHTGVWKDFADASNVLQGGDLISLYAAIYRLSQADAARKLLGHGDANTRAVATVPEKTPKLSNNLTGNSGEILEPVRVRPHESIFRHREYGLPKGVWWYHTPAGHYAFATVRYEVENGARHKYYLPWRFIDGGWRQKSAPKPRLLYNLPALTNRPTAPVLMVEGERTAEAAQTLLQGMVVTCWAGGANAVGHADLTPLRGRTVRLVPDADEPGNAAMQQLAETLHALGCDVSLVDTAGQPEGWDLADEPTWSTADAIEFCKARMKPYAPPSVQPVQDVQGASESADLPVLPQPVDAPDPRLSRGTPRRRPGEAVPVINAPRGTDPDSEASSDLIARSGILQSAAGVDERNRVHVNQANAVAVLRVSRYAGQVWYDAFRQRPMTRITLAPKQTQREWTDADDLFLTAYFQSVALMPKMSPPVAAAAMQQYAHANAVHPLLNYLESLTWDGVERLPTFMADIYNTPQDEYHAAAGRCWLVGMAARAYEPGCQMDTVVCLEGQQGLAKSKSLEILGGEFYALNSNEFGTVEFLKAIEGVWLMEIADLSGFSGADLQRVTATITSRKDRYRGSYAKAAATRLRIATFALTTNKGDYLKDETGARRFVPITVQGDVNLALLRANRDAYLAEAVARYKRSESWWDLPKLAAAEATLARFDFDPWYEVIADYCRAQNGRPVRLQGVFEALGVKLELQTRPHQTRIGAMLRHLGYERKVVRKGGGVTRAWVNMLNGNDTTIGVSEGPVSINTPDF